MWRCCLTSFVCSVHDALGLSVFVCKFDEDGYLLLEGVYSAEHCKRLRDRCKQIVETNLDLSTHPKSVFSTTKQVQQRFGMLCLLGRSCHPAGVFVLYMPLSYVREAGPWHFDGVLCSQPSFEYYPCAGGLQKRTRSKQWERDCKSACRSIKLFCIARGGLFI